MTFKIRWKDGNLYWISLKDLKESNPVEMTKYVTTKDIQDESAFVWWEPYTPRKKGRGIDAV